MSAGSVVFVLGPTASGKSDAAVAIARSANGEIVSADAFAVYRGFDIGTAKPSASLRKEIPHHLIDVADPREPYSAGRWAREALAAIEAIEARRRIPVVSGGSHFYVRALVAGLPGTSVDAPRLRRYFRAPWSAERRRLRKRMIDVLDPTYAARVPSGDTARIGRALEIVLSTGRRVSERAHVASPLGERRLIKLALQIPREAIYTRVAERVSAMWKSGWPREVEELLAAGIPRSAPAFRAIGYGELAARAAGELDEAEARERIVARTRALAKRQETWLAAESGLERVDPDAAARRAIEILGGGA